MVVTLERLLESRSSKQNMVSRSTSLSAPAEVQLPFYERKTTTGSHPIANHAFAKICIIVIMIVMIISFFYTFQMWPGRCW